MKNFHQWRTKGKMHDVDAPQGLPAGSETEGKKKQTLGVYSSKDAAAEMETAIEDGFAGYPCLTKKTVGCFHRQKEMSCCLCFLLHSAAAIYWPSVNVLDCVCVNFRDIGLQYVYSSACPVHNPAVKTHCSPPDYFLLLFKKVLTQKQHSRQMQRSSHEIMRGMLLPVESPDDGFTPQIHVQHKRAACLTAIWEYLGQRDVESLTCEVYFHPTSRAQE